MAVECTQLYDPTRFFRDFVSPAHATRFTHEIITHPRNKQFFRPTNAAIASGRYIFKKCRCNWHDPVIRECESCKNVAALPKLVDKKYQVLRANIDRKDSSPLKKKNVLLTYDDGAFVTFIQFELDRHYSAEPTPEDIQSVDAAFWEQVNNLRDVMQDIGFDVAWTTSPGNINPLTGEICHGLYAWIKLDSVEMVSDLRKRIREFKEYHGLDDIECCWDRRNNNTRLPGQRWTQLADPETATMLDAAPIDEPQMSFITFAQEWEALQPVSADTLFSASRSWFADNKSHTEHTCKPDAAPATPSKTVAVADENITPLTPAIKPGRYIEFTYTAEELESFQISAQPDTFKIKKKSKIHSKLAFKYDWDESRLEEMTAEAHSIYQSLRMGTSIQPSFHRRCLKWMIDNKKLSKLSNSKWHENDEKDSQRLAYCKDVSIEHLLPILKMTCNLSFRELSRFTKLLGYWKDWRGRVAAAFIYGCPDSLFSKSEWFSLLRKIKNVFIVIDEFATNKCRQWGLAQSVVEKVKSTEQASHDVQVIIEEEETVYVTPCSTTAAVAPQPPEPGCVLHQNENIHDDYDEFDKPWLILTQGHCALT